MSEEEVEEYRRQLDGVKVSGLCAVNVGVGYNQLR